jgi:exopolysaccharide biosynthesis polyprenyl glycosylphosphotransferase
MSRRVETQEALPALTELDPGVTAAGAAPAPPLRRILIGVDAVMLALGWSAAEFVFRLGAGDDGSPLINVVLFTIAGVAAGLFLMSAAGLYRRRICQVRSVELARIARVALAMAVLSGMRARGFGGDITIAAAAAAGSCIFLGVAIERGFLREWIAGRRASGDFRAPVIVVGTGAGAFRTASFLDAHPVLGFDVLGVVGTRDEAEGAPFAWLGGLDEMRVAAELSGASGVVIDSGSLTGDQLNDAVRTLNASGVHVHVTSGLRGVDARRITLSAMADETMLHIAPSHLSRRQEIAKRLLDVSVASTLIVLGAPVMVLVALAVWLNDRGPILFRQTRVGHNDEVFTVYKFRTMAVDAESRLAELRGGNRRGGPLFKMDQDPRVTRVGRFLRSTSLDELPQLWNVLEGTMSLVGPRPALPDEVRDFDRDLLARTRVKPGVTGLWQVEARDLASFDLYRRYDLLYVESWSLGLDLAIIGRTVTSTLMRGIRSVVGRGAGAPLG